ncbi:MAG: PilZ domain-containing protein [Trichlorobacter sp.]|jgi:hypothetical protein
MSDKRDKHRTKKRIALQFGIGSDLQRRAFSEDLSPMGMFIKTANVSNPNTVLRIELLHGEQVISLDARVMWAKRVPQNLFHLVKKSGMGVRIIRFHSGQQQYLDLCEQPFHAQRHEARLHV